MLRFDPSGCAASLCGKAVPFRRALLLPFGKAAPCRARGVASLEIWELTESPRLSAQLGGRAAYLVLTARAEPHTYL
jgi:hypothetical protein